MSELLDLLPPGSRPDADGMLIIAIVSGGRMQDVLVRIIPGVTADTHAHVLTGHEGSKFGLPPAAAAALIGRIDHTTERRDHHRTRSQYGR